MKGKLLLFAAALAVASALVAVPLTTASSVDNKLAIGQSLHFLGGPGNSAARSSPRAPSATPAR